MTTTEDKKPSDIKSIKDFFGLSAKDAMTEAKKLTPADKAQLGDGIRNGSLTY